MNTTGDNRCDEMTPKKRGPRQTLARRADKRSQGIDSGVEARAPSVNRSVTAFGDQYR